MLAQIVSACLASVHMTCAWPMLLSFVYVISVLAQVLAPVSSADILPAVTARQVLASYTLDTFTPGVRTQVHFFM